jgi:hypothetical protein
MVVAIMQPYFLPYLGYFQLVTAVDSFVFFDNVNFIKKGWIHRNNILFHNEAHRFTIPLNKASQNKLINETYIADYASWKKDFLHLIENSYKKAPYYEVTSECLKELLNKKDFQLISDLASESVISVAALLGLNTRFLFSKDIDYSRGIENKGSDKIISICKQLGATTYINPKNGVELYNNNIFKTEGIELKFIHMNDIHYLQFKNDKFIPYLSIIDALMFNPVAEIKNLLSKFELHGK